MWQCAPEVVVHELDESDANDIVEVLSNHQIDTQKLRIEGGRTITYNIAVSAAQRLDAIRVLNQNSLPRRKDKGYHEVFQTSGLIPTSAEEKAKKLAAIEGEIERQLKLVEGILDVQVQIVMPEESALKTAEDQSAPTTASVTLLYLPGAEGSKPLSEAQVAAIVAGGVEKLRPERVVVVMTPAVARAVGGGTSAPIDPRSNKKVQTILVAALVAVILVALIALYFWFQMRQVRERFLRLQGEIQKARRRTEQPQE